MSYCSCTAVILPAACGEARGGVVVAEGISRWKAETHKANHSWAAHRGKMPCPETRSSMGFGAAPHVFPKLGEFSHKMELWPCDFQRRVFETKHKLFLQGGLPLLSHTSSPEGKERSPPAARQTLHGQWAACRGLMTPSLSPPRRQFSWKGLP